MSELALKTISVSGPDAFEFLQNQLTNDLTLLESDHQAIHTLVDALQDSAARLAAADDRAGDDTARDLAVLLRALTAHLDDEEDLIVPIVLDHSEANLGLV